jgi:hypothetical protein
MREMPIVLELLGGASSFICEKTKNKQSLVGLT